VQAEELETEEMEMLGIKNQVFQRILGAMPIITEDKDDKLVINKAILLQAAKETNKIIDILLLHK